MTSISHDASSGLTARFAPVVLRNNVVLITEPVAGHKTSAIGFWFSVGSRSESNTVRGVTHFVEHLLFKGTRTRSAFDIACTFDRLGGYVNAYTEREAVCLYCVVPSAHMHAALEVMCDMACSAAFEQREIDRERKVIESEILAAADDPEEAALDAVGESVWPGQMISASISGTVQDVDKLTRDELYRWYDAQFVHGELTVCIAGGCADEQAVSLLENLPVHKKPCLPGLPRVPEEPGADHTSGIPSVPNRFAGQNPVWHPGLNCIRAPFKQEQFFVLYPFSVPMTERAYYALSVFNALAGDAMSSRLFQRLREQGGFCYTVYSFSSLYTETGCWCAYASSSKVRSVRVMQDLLDEIHTLKTKPVTDDELNAAREHLCGEELIASEDPEYRMKRIARNYMAGYPVCDTDDVITQLRAVTRDDVQECIARLLVKPQEAAVIFGPELSPGNKTKIGEYFAAAY